MFLIIFLLTQIDSTFAAKLKEKAFETDFVEIVQYKEFETQDTFRGTIACRGSNIEMELTYPSREIYLIKNDTLFVKGQGEVTAYPLENEALKLLNFQFLTDSVNYDLKIFGDSLDLSSKNEALFLKATLINQNGIPKILSIEDKEKILKFFFKNWRFYE